MPHHTLQRAASRDEQAFLQTQLASATTTASRWWQGAQNALVLWAVSLLGFLVMWLCTAWLARRLAGIDLGLHSAVAPWVLGIATLLCAAYAIGSSVLWVRRWKDHRPSLLSDLAGAQVSEEHYAFDAVQRFQEPEHGGLIYFLRTAGGRVLTLHDHDSAGRGAQEGDPLASSFKPMSRLVMVRAPRTGWIISSTFYGEPLEAGQPIELTVSPERWPKTDEYCSIPWAELQSTLGATHKR
jgi:hypothetical protein